MGDAAEKNGRLETFFSHFTLLVTQKLTVLEDISVLPTYRNLVPIYKINVFLRSPRSHNDVITILNHVIAHGTHNTSELQIEM